MGSQRVRHDWAIELNWTELKILGLQLEFARSYTLWTERPRYSLRKTVIQPWLLPYDWIEGIHSFCSWRKMNISKSLCSSYRTSDIELKSTLYAKKQKQIQPISLWPHTKRKIVNKKRSTGYPDIEIVKLGHPKYPDHYVREN